MKEGNFSQPAQAADRPPQEKQGLTDRYARSIESYLNDPQRGTLRPHQREVFEDFQEFFEHGHTRGYVENPTGTGKTVLFVELSTALLETDPSLPRPKILVVTPSKDLVHQTMGRTGQKGYGKFAPDLKVGSYFSDTPDEERDIDFQEECDVVVTTYTSLTIMSDRKELRPITEADKLEMLQKPKTYGAPRTMSEIDHIMRVPSGRSYLDQFDVIILDEAHHLFGDKATRSFKSLSKDTVVIGFTATPDYNVEKQLTQLLPEKIHSLELNEAIWLGLLAPVAPVGIPSGIKIVGSNLYDASGEFIDSKLGYLAEDPTRNELVVNAAKTMARNGIGTIVSCIAGNGALHARHIAGRLNREGISAAAVHSNVDSRDRKRIYDRFERGEIDVLTFIGVLGEGWDSQRAKAIINARPTRSVVFAKQRLGRVTRPGDTAFVIDIIDKCEGQNQAITATDVLNEGDMLLGQTVGTANDISNVERVIESLAQVAPLQPVMRSTYKDIEELLSTLEQLDRGRLTDKNGNLSPDWALANMACPTYSGVSDDVIAKIELLTGITIKKKLAKQGNSVRTVYSINGVSGALYKLPTVEPQKYFTEDDGTKRLSVEGFMILFSKRYPGLTVQIIEEELDKLEENLDWIPGRYQSSPPKIQHRHYNVIKMYNAGQETIDLLNASLSQRFSRSSAT